MQKNRTQPKRSGSALLDVVAASIVAVMVIVPSVTMMRRGIDAGRRLQTRQQMTLQCSSLLEQHMAQLSVSFRSQTEKGLLKYEGAQLGYRIVCSDRAAFGGVPGRLMGTSVTVWHDLNKNRLKGYDEPGITLYSKSLNPTVVASLSTVLKPSPTRGGS